MRVGPSHYGSDRHESSAQKADRIVKEETERLGWHENELRTRRKGDKDKIAVARRLRQETTMSLKWIAQRLEMGSWTYVSNLLNQKAPIQTPAQGSCLFASVSIVRTDTCLEQLWGVSQSQGATVTLVTSGSATR